MPLNQVCDLGLATKPLFLYLSLPTLGNHESFKWNQNLGRLLSPGSGKGISTIIAKMSPDDVWCVPLINVSTDDCGDPLRLILSVPEDTGYWDQQCEWVVTMFHVIDVYTRYSYYTDLKLVWACLWIVRFMDSIVLNHNSIYSFEQLAFQMFLVIYFWIQI